jgi:hypothetical protein
VRADLQRLLKCLHGPGIVQGIHPAFAEHKMGLFFIIRLPVTGQGAAPEQED